MDASRIETRHNQGWVGKVAETLEDALVWVKDAMEKREVLSIAYYDDIIDLSQYAVDHNIHTDLLSDQISCHAPYDGSYCP